jgi:murein L,D-transpeptidase YafK
MGLVVAEISAADEALPDSVDAVLIAETDSAKLHRYERVQDILKHRETRYMSIGENGVGKERAWDRRTPLGIYFANEQLDTSRIYPNAWDEVNARTGDGIWIHGVDRNGGRRPPLDTDGCIALPNEDLLELEAQIQLLTTPVIITRQIRVASVEQIRATGRHLNEALDEWARSFRDGDWHTYLSLYAPGFMYRGLDKGEWSTYRVRSAAARPLHDYSIDDVLLLADPEKDGLFLSRFRQTIMDESGQIVTTKRLYWRLMPDGELKIVAEDNG